MASVALDAVSKIYPNGYLAVEHLDLQVADGEFLVLLGPSGCGKSTVLRMIAGLEEVTRGTVFLNGRPANDLMPSQRDIAMVFQNGALYPHFSVRENLAFPLQIAKDDHEAIRGKVVELSRALGIDQTLDRKPATLSGGQRQRVAMGRAIIRQPSVFLMDEPLSSLDTALRTELRLEIGSMTRELGITTLYVTHDQVEALTLADRIAVLRDGVLEDLGTPGQIYDDPATAFTAGFLGTTQLNLVVAQVQRCADGVLLDLGNQRLLVPWADPRARPLLGHFQQQVMVGIRVDDLVPTDDPRPGMFLDGRVVTLEYQGSSWTALVDAGITTAEFVPRPRPRPRRRSGGFFRRPTLEDAAPAQEHVGIHRRSHLMARMPSGMKWQRSTPVRLAVDPSRLLFFGADGRRVDPVIR
ncbi:ABC transporter ATP-binding protein [Actinocorallia longicatena]|uniref:ABC transporter domain-containing protein n=1 Tax=Actinocorallia longicatena TaxID=111803 RepID=A0ABP6Q1V2_9ACTN